MDRVPFLTIELKGLDREYPVTPVLPHAKERASDCLGGNMPRCGTSVCSEVVAGFPDAAQH